MEMSQLLYFWKSGHGDDVVVQQAFLWEDGGDSECKEDLFTTTKVSYVIVKLYRAPLFTLFTH